MDSDRPLLRGNVLSLPNIGNYEQLIMIESDPMTDLFVGHIRVDVDDLTSKPYLNVFLDGKQYLKDYLMLDDSMNINFGQHVLLNRVSKPIVIQIKKTATGAGTLTATSFVDGIEKPKY